MVINEDSVMPLASLPTLGCLLLGQDTCECRWGPLTQSRNASLLKPLIKNFFN